MKPWWENVSVFLREIFFPNFFRALLAVLLSYLVIFPRFFGLQNFNRKILKFS